MQHKLNELSKELSSSHHREREVGNTCDVIRRQLSMRSHLADPEKVKYLRQVLFQYMMGAEGKVNAALVVTLGFKTFFYLHRDCCSVSAVMITLCTCFYF